MKTPSPTQDYDRIKEQAKQRAQELRREAIGDFWRGADAAWSATLATAERSARRLVHRLARHAETRAAAPTPPCKEC